MSEGSGETSKRPRRPFAVAVSLFGELLVTVGILCGLFAGYQLWWTNVVSRYEANQARQQFEDSGGDWTTAPQTGKPFALAYIPRLKDKVWALPVLQGVDTSQLAKGIGHYPSTALPGEVGNFAIAAHRATHGEPFADFDQLQNGDKVYIETPTTWYTYILLKDRIVQPEDIWVIEPRPPTTAAFTSDRLITLTTCHPRWGSTQRWIYWGQLEGTTPHDQPPLPGMNG